MATNWQSGGQWAMQGAQMGSNFGPWGAVIGAAAGFVFGKSAPDNEKIMMDNYNNEVVKYAARDLFDMRREQNNENMRTAQALASYQSGRRVQTAQMNAQFGAADIIGSSSKALQQTLDLQTNEAMNQTLINAETGIENYNTRVDQMTNQRIASLKRFKGQAPMDAGQLVTQGVNLYKQYKSSGATGNSMLESFQGLWSGQGNTPKAIETYDPRWKNMSAGTGGSALNTFNSSVDIS